MNSSDGIILMTFFVARFFLCALEDIAYICRPNLTNTTNKTMKISRIDHLGIGVKSIDEVLPYFEGVLGLKCYAVEEVADQMVKTAFLRVGEVKLELLEPTSADSAVAKWMEKGGRGVHHVAFAIEDGVAEALTESEGKGIRLIDKAPRPGAEQMSIAFLHPKFTAGILTELCEPAAK